MHGSERKIHSVENVRRLISVREFESAHQIIAEMLDSGTIEYKNGHCLLGEISFHRNDDVDARLNFEKALSTDPAWPEAHYGLSLVLASEGDFDACVRHAQFAMNSEPTNSRYLAQFGYGHLCMGNFQIAEKPLRRATLTLEKNPHVWNNLGIVLRVKGFLEESTQCFVRALEIDPDFQRAKDHLDQLRQEIQNSSIVDLGGGDRSFSLRARVPLDGFEGLSEVNQLRRSGLVQKAIDFCEKCLLSEPDNQFVSIVLSELYESVGDIESSVDTIVAHLSNHSTSFHAIGALGLIHLRAHSFDFSESPLKIALENDPEHIDYILGLASTYTELERYKAAGPFYDLALKIAPDDKRIMGLMISNLANQCRYEEAFLIIEKLQNQGMTVGKTGAVFTALGRFDDALIRLNQDVKNQPNDPGCRFLRAELLLLSENFAEGWDDYAFRGLNATKNFRVLPFQVWRGEPLHGKKIIVLAEQGLGDQIMFSSCLPDLMKLEPDQIIFEVSKRIHKTIDRSFPDCRIISSGQNNDFEWVTEFPDVDFYIPLGDLPRFFRRSVEEFPESISYLKADPDRVRYWQEKLSAISAPPYIGFSWRGGTERTRTSLRTLTIDQFSDISEKSKASWICLQYGNVEEDLAVARDMGFNVHYWPESISDLDEFAALICALDLIVTVCNTTVHYSGALGKEVWVLAPKIPEWRYGTRCESLPWYRSSKMFRQIQSGDWGTVISQVSQKLSLRFPLE